MRSLTILFLLLSFLGYSQNSQNSERTVGASTYTVCNPDSSCGFMLCYDDVLNQYKFCKTNRSYYYYNLNNLDSAGYSQYRPLSINDTLWTNNMKWTNIFNSNGSVTDSLIQYWLGNNWTDSSVWYKNNYDVNNNLISIIDKGYNNGWHLGNRITNTYDFANRQTTSKYQNWYSANNVWFDRDSVYFVYDNNNLLVSKYYYRNISDPTVWNYYAKDSIQYNSFNLSIHLLKQTIDLNNGGWINTKEIFWTYDSNNRLLSRTCLGNNASANLWESDNSDFYSYDSFGRQIHDSTYNGLPIRYYNTCAFVGISEEYMINKFFIFPNPSNSTLSITSSVDYFGIKIINSIGQTIADFEDKPITISVAELSNGIYFIQLLDEKGMVLKTEKFIKE